MKSLVDRIKELENKIDKIGGVPEKLINEAEKKLDLKFPKEYYEYLLNYGVISFFGTEWKGLGTDSYLNVVNSTLKERELNSNFPSKYFIVEDLGVDALIIISNENGEVYEYQNGKILKKCGNLVDYFEECIKRSN